MEGLNKGGCLAVPASPLGQDAVPKTLVTLKTPEGSRVFKSIKQAARHYGIDASIVVQRRFRGWSMEQAFGLAAPPSKGASPNCRTVAVTHNGQTHRFPSLRKAAEHFGLRPSMVSKRLINGWGLEQALGIHPPPERPPSRARPVEVVLRGRKKRFRSLADASTAFGVDAKLVSRRLAEGWSPEEALGVKSRPGRRGLHDRPVTVKVDGVDRTYPSLAQAARAHGLSPSRVSSRIKQLNWTLEQALGLTPAPPKKLPSNAKALRVMHDGTLHRFRSIGEAAKAFGLSTALVRKRWKIFKWPLAEALGIIPHSRNFVGRSQRVSFTHQGKRYVYKSILDAANAHGINHGTVLSRLKLWGGNIRQALGLAPPPGHAKTCYGFIYLIRHRASGRQYVGQTLLPVRKRWEEHIRSSEAADPQGPHLRCAIRKHGRKAFSVEEIDQTLSFHDANSKERHWIKKLKTLYPAGFNMTRGGGGINLGRPIVVEGVRYPSIADAARAYGLTGLKVSSRLRDFGWSIDQAFGLEPAPPRAGAPIEISLVIAGRTRNFPSIKAAADELQKDYGVVRSRLQSCGWTVEQAFDLEPPPIHDKSDGRHIKFVFNGERFKYASVKEAAMTHGLERSLVDARVNRLGWSFAQSLEIAPPPKQKSNKSKCVRFTHEGVWHRYESIDAAARAHGLKPSTVAARIRVGRFTWAQALGLAPAPAPNTRPDCAIEFVHNGKEHRYRSVSHAAQLHDLKVSTVTARIRSGYTIQQAIGLAKPPLRGRWLNHRSA